MANTRPSRTGPFVSVYSRRVSETMLYRADIRGSSAVPPIYCTRTGLFQAISPVREEDAVGDTVLNGVPSDLMWRGIEDLTEHLQGMAEGSCEPRFYLSSLDPGVGKTQTVVHFLRALLSSPQHGDVGVIIFLFTKQQIEEVVTRANLDPTDYAVLMTAEDEAERNLIDSGAPDPNSARVLFTTQQRLQLLCKDDKKFSDVEAYHFRGRPRQVRIWD